MADIQLRFNKDMLVLSTPIKTQLERVGMDFDRDNELALLIEPEILHEAYSLEVAVGAQCIVADTANLTPARLAHSRCTATAEELADAALAVVNELTPQHVLVELAPCGLPLDAESADSLNENRDQYERAARTFSQLEPLFDAYFLNGFTDTTDIKCALMGLRKVTDKPVFVSVDLGVASADDATGSDCVIGANGAAASPAATSPAAYTLGGKGRETVRDAFAVMAEYGAQVGGFAIKADPQIVQLIVEEAKSTCILPILVQLEVKDINPEQKNSTVENPYFEPDTMVEAAERLQATGVQFLRAAGNATPAYTGALVAATMGEDVTLPSFAPEVKFTEERDLDELANTLRARLDAALGN